MATVQFSIEVQGQNGEWFHWGNATTKRGALRQVNTAIAQNPDARQAGFSGEWEPLVRVTMNGQPFEIAWLDS